MRQINLWDPRTLRAPIANKTIDNASGQLYPLYDEDINLCFVVGKGDTIIRFYELSFLEEEAGQGGAVIEKSNEFQSSREPITGICMLPKRSCNVRNVEAARLLKATVGSVAPISFVVPRAEHLKEFFQEDLYPDTRSKTSSVSVYDWTESIRTGAPLPPPAFESMKPEDMLRLSEKPVEPAGGGKTAGSGTLKRTSVDFKKELEQKEAEDKQRDDMFTRLQTLAIQRSKYHPNASGGGHGFKVDATPVHDDDDDDNDWDD